MVCRMELELQLSLFPILQSRLYSEKSQSLSNNSLSTMLTKWREVIKTDSCWSHTRWCFLTKACSADCQSIQTPISLRAEPARRNNATAAVTLLVGVKATGTARGEQLSSEAWQGFLYKLLYYPLYMFYLNTLNYTYASSWVAYKFKHSIFHIPRGKQWCLACLQLGLDFRVADSQLMPASTSSLRCAHNPLS